MGLRPKPRRGLCPRTPGFAFPTPAVTAPRAGRLASPLALRARDRHNTARAAASSRGWVMGRSWGAAGIWIRFAAGIFSDRKAAYLGGVRRSASPEITRVGTLIEAS